MKNELEIKVVGRINRILHMSDEGRQKATLAKMRRGIGRLPGELPEIWSLIMEGVDDSLLNERFETAFFNALTLFAWHQQGHDPKDEPMYKEGMTLGKAAAYLFFKDESGDKEQAKERIIKRFGIITASKDTEDLFSHVKSMVSLLKSKDITLDYGDLAKAFYYSSDRDTLASIYLRWGRDFYGEINKDKTENNTEEEVNE